jgi:hypothetical protein
MLGRSDWTRLRRLERWCFIGSVALGHDRCRRYIGPRLFGGEGIHAGTDETHLHCPIAWRRSGCLFPRLGYLRLRYDVLGLRAAAGGTRSAAGRLVPVRTDLHPRQCDGQGRVQARGRRTLPNRRLSRHRGADIPDEKDNWQFGSGASFYLDATQEPYAKNYRMYSYVAEELPALIGHEFPADMARQSITTLCFNSAMPGAARWPKIIMSAQFIPNTTPA